MKAFCKRYVDFIGKYYNSVFGGRSWHGQVIDAYVRSDR